MKITVKLIGPFIHHFGFSEKEFEIGEGSTVESVLTSLAIRPSRPYIITRNGRAVAPVEKLEDGDRLVISPIFSGG